MKTIITFGSGQLEWLDVRANDVALVIEAENMNEARSIVFKTEIGNRYCTSYIYEDKIDEFKTKYNMREYTLKELLSKTKD